MSENQLPSQKARVYSFKELTLWRTKLPAVEHGVLPPTNNHPNPLVAGNMVYASIFSPGAVCALDRETGKLIWRRELPKLAAASAYLAGGKLFAKTAQTLYAMQPESGEILWSFCPYGESGERLYSSPTLYMNRVYIGDRRGFLHCLDASSGETLWRKRTNRAKKDDVNTTPIVMKGLVIVGTNARKAFAFDAETGKLAWLRKLDGPSVFGPLVYRGLAVLVTQSVYLLDSTDGKVVRHFTWEGEGVSTAETTTKNIVVTLRGKLPAEGETQVVGLDKSGVRYSASNRAFCLSLRYVDQKNLIYFCHLEGVDVCRPESGDVVCKIKLDEQRSRVGLIEVKRNTIYALSGKGNVYALRHPRI
jgi:outer membrane protein assembly factor BamB